ncbi:MAG: response regulator [Oligoflexia bacterium]|nr:response regulator [Oligoflexia bacterium]
MSLSAVPVLAPEENSRRVGVFLADTEGLCTWVSPEIYLLTGLSASDLIGQFWFRCLEGRDRRRAIQTWELEIGKSRPFSFSGKLETPAKKHVNVFIQAEVIPAQRGQSAYCVGMIMDTSAKEALFEDSQRYERLSEALQRIERSEQESVTLYTALNESEATITKLTDDLQASARRNLELTSRIEDLNKQMAGLEEQLGLANSAKFSLEKQIQSLKDAHELRLKELSAQDNEKRLALEAQSSHAQLELDGLIRAKKAIDDELKQVKEELSAHKLSRQGDADAAKFIENELRSRLQTLEGILEREQSSAKSSLEAKEKELKQTKTELEGQLLKMLGEASDLLNSKKQLADKIAALERALDEGKSENKRLCEAHKEELQALAAAAQAKESALSTDIQQLQATNNKMSERLSELERQRDHDLALIEQQKKIIEEHEARRLSLEKRVREHEASIEQGNRAIQVITEQNIAEENSRKTQAHQLAEAQAALEQAHARHLSLESALAEATRERQAADARLSLLARKDTRHGLALDWIQRQHTALTQEIFAFLPSAPLSPQQSHAVADLKTSADYCQKLIAGLGHLTTLSTQPSSSQLPVHLRKFLGPLTALVDFRASQRELEFFFDDKSNIPDLLYLDPVKLELIFSLILGNLLHTLPPFARVTCSARVQHEDERAALIRFELLTSSITDNDRKRVSISQLQDVLAIPYSQRELLGIDIANQILQFASIQVVVDEKEDGFTLGFEMLAGKTADGATHGQTALLPAPPIVIAPQSIPASVPQPAEQVAIKEETIPATQPSSSQRLRVLLADDNRINQNMMRKLLIKLDCEVTVAINGRDAFERFAKDPFDLVLMDCQMPQVDGYQAARDIKKHEKARNTPQVPIFGLSAHLDSSTRQRCLESGMEDCLSKPLQEEQVIKLLSTLRK